jgi:type IV pilus assembly protein PilQ
VVVVAIVWPSAILVGDDRDPGTPTSQPSSPAAGAAAPSQEALAPSPTGLDEVTVTDTGLVDVHVRDTEISAILEMLSYQARTNIVASTSVQGKISANLYGVTLAEALDAILTPNQYACRQLGNTLFVGTPQEITAQLPPPLTRLFKLRYITKIEAATAVKALLSPAGSLTVSGSEESAQAGSGAAKSIMEIEEVGSDYLIVTDVPERLAAIEELLRQIDVRPKQVLIEATILRATLTEDNQFGIDFTLLGGVDFLDVSSTSVGSQNLVLGSTPPIDFEHTTFNVGTDMISGLPPGGGFSFGIIRNNIAAFVRALEEVTDVAVVANPKVVALNKQEASVQVGRRDGYLTTTVTETAAIQSVEFLETGTQIRFVPCVNDNGTVRLEVHPKDSNGGLTAANLPFEETTEAHASILVDDGHTVLIGGLFRERTISSKSQIPVLGNIPGVGLLFQSATDGTVREEVIILLTVHVLKNTDEEQARYADLLDDVERIRVGSRKGLMGVGRERLAQAFYQEALCQMERDDLEKALLNVRMALHNNPKHLAALKLKERLLGRRLWDDEGTRMRTFLLDLIRREQDSGGTEVQDELFGRPRLDLVPHRLPPTEASPEPTP